MEVARLLAERDRIRLTPGGAGGERGGAAPRVLTLWQTSMLRRTRLKVLDEVDERALVLRPHVPARAAALLRRARGRARRRRIARTPSCRRSCAWAAGSAATATAIRSSPPMCSAQPCACRAGARSSSTSTSCMCSAASCRSTAASSASRTRSATLAERSPDRSSHRARRALSPRHYRHLCAARRDRSCASATARRRGTRRRCAALRRARPSSSPISTSIHRSLVANGSGGSPAAACAGCAAPRRVRLPPRRRRPAPELRRARARRRRAVRRGRARHAAIATLPEDERGRAAASPSCATPRPLASPHRRLLATRRARELAIVHTAAARRTGATGRAAVPNYVISKATASPTCSRSRCCCKEAGLLRPRGRHARRQHRAAVRDHRATCATAARVMDELLRLCRSTPRCSRAAAACRR